ncbi:MAG: hypothetical protein IPQ05_01505 [Leptospiraceae bacterium]|nr:hypothetical protein [Leptospiraceae bacterium]
MASPTESFNPQIQEYKFPVSEELYTIRKSSAWIWEKDKRSISFKKGFIFIIVINNSKKI